MYLQAGDHTLEELGKRASCIMMFNSHKAANIELRRENNKVIGMVLEKAAESDLRFNALDKVITIFRALNLEVNTSVSIPLCKALNFKV